MATEGIIIWRGGMGSPPGHLARSVFFEPTSAVAIGTLGTALATTYTDCKFMTRSYVDRAAVDATVPASTVNVDKKATIYFRDPTTLQVLKFSFPAPKAAIIEGTDQGERITSAAVSAIVGLINTATGKSYTALYGVVTQKK